jgi:hypothetical protein
MQQLLPKEDVATTICGAASTIYAAAFTERDVATTICGAASTIYAAAFT